MSTTTILATTSAVNASSVASSGSAAPAIWMLMMFVVLIAYAAYLHGDECSIIKTKNAEENARKATFIAVFVGVLLIPIACLIAW